MIRLYIIGICILITAIVANAIVINIGLKSWYDIFELYQSYGSDLFKKLSFIDYLWLIILYPLVLGTGGYLGDLIYKTLC